MLAYCFLTSDLEFAFKKKKVGPSVINDVMFELCTHFFCCFRHSQPKLKKQPSHHTPQAILARCRVF